MTVPHRVRASETVSVSEALRVAADVADASGVTVREVHTPDGHQAVAELLRDVWRTSDATVPVAPELLRALTHAGHYVAGAFHGGDLLGACVAFTANRPGRRILHSHVSGVLPQARNRHIGTALKMHQRAWALGAGIGCIQWTFDPLVRRNAYLNLTRLGGYVARYYENFYGSMTDGLNAHDRSDRCLLTWDLHRRWPPGRPEAALPDAAVLSVVREHERELLGATVDGRPALRLSVLEHGTGPVYAWIPANIYDLRAKEPSLAAQWRDTLRDALGAALASGRVATGMSLDGWYELTTDNDAHHHDADHYDVDSDAARGSSTCDA